MKIPHICETESKMTNFYLDESGKSFSSFAAPVSQLSKKELWEKTIEVWDYLVENNYRPADFSAGIVTMRYEGFRKLIKVFNNCVSVQETPVYRNSAVWINDIEVSYMELRDKRSWMPIDNWEPLNAT